MFDANPFVGEWTDNTLKKCSKKGCHQFKQFVSPTLGNVRYCLTFIPSQASRFELPEMLPTEDLNGKISVGELGIAWMFYKGRN
jgi:hypothetical protein